MIKISFTGGTISEVNCDDARDAASIVSAMQGSVSAPTTTTRTKSHRNGRPARMGSWKTSELKYVLENLGKVKDSDIATNHFLLQRHVPSAVYNLIGQTKRGKFSSKRLARMYKELNSEGLAPNTSSI